MQSRQQTHFFLQEDLLKVLRAAFMALKNRSWCWKVEHKKIIGHTQQKAKSLPSNYHFGNCIPHMDQRNCWRHPVVLHTRAQWGFWPWLDSQTIFEEFPLFFSRLEMDHFWRQITASGASHDEPFGKSSWQLQFFNFFCCCSWLSIHFNIPLCDLLEFVPH